MPELRSFWSSGAGATSVTCARDTPGWRVAGGTPGWRVAGGTPGWRVAGDTPGWRVAGDTPRLEGPRGYPRLGGGRRGHPASVLMTLDGGSGSVTGGSVPAKYTHPHTHVHIYVL